MGRQHAHANLTRRQTRWTTHNSYTRLALQLAIEHVEGRSFAAISGPLCGDSRRSRALRCRGLESPNLSRRVVKANTWTIWVVLLLAACTGAEGTDDGGPSDGASIDAGDRLDSAVPPPDAARARCAPDLMPPANGSVDRTTGLEGDVARYACNEGYVLTGNDGSSTRTCEADGTWSGSDPECSPVVTPCTPNPCLNGGRCTEEGESFTCDCDGTGYSGVTCMMPIVCGDAMAPLNGSVSAVAATYPNVVTYACDMGYTLSGSTFSQCTADGTFRPAPPACDPDPCADTLSAPSNGTVDRTTGATGDVATYACNAGYTLVGTSTRACLADGTWSGATPSCMPNPCSPDLVAPTNGSVDRTAGVTGDIATYSCNLGYSLSGSAMRTCQPTGTWSGTAPTCTPNPCSPDLVAPTNGTVDRTRGVTGDVATYACSMSYSLLGDPTRTCRPTGAWSGEAPWCSPTICSVDGWCWENRLPQGSTLRSVWVTSPTNAWAFGDGGVILRWNGTEWRGVPSGTTANLTGVWGSSANDIWAVGPRGTILRWNGTSWAPVPSGTLNNLTAAWGSSATDVWAVGGEIRRWNGTSWTASPTPVSARLWGVWGSSSSDVWAVGSAGTILRWNGSIWSSVPSPTTRLLSSVWGTSATNVWAVGELGTILRWNGVSWTELPSGTTDGLMAVWGTSESDVWVVSESGAVFRWNGVELVAVTGVGPLANLAVHGSSSSDVWMVGAWGEMARWNGTRWRSYSSGPIAALSTGGGSATDAWAMGREFYRRTAGSRWTRVPRSGLNFAHAVWASSPTDVWAVSVAGGIERWNGSTWSNVPSGTSQSLNALWGSSATDVWAVGDGGTIVRWNGTSWSRVDSGVVTDLTAVWGSSATNIWAAGVRGAMLRWNGSSWTRVDSGTFSDLYGLWGSAANDVWAVGDVGTIVRWNGTMWTPVPGERSMLLEVWGTSSSDVWAVGVAGAIHHWNGTTWRTMISGTSVPLRSVFGSATDVTVVGDDGVILRYRR
jgi:hypothetical protein